MSSISLEHPGPTISLPNFSLSRLRFFRSADLAMDLGTANTLIYQRDRGIVLNEPSLVVVDQKTQRPLAIGREAKEMFGRTSGALRCVRPMKDGVIADFGMTSLMIQHMLKQVRSGFHLIRPRLVVGIPSGITQVEKRAVIDSALTCGVRQVHLVDEPMAAALGAGLPIDKPIGNMIVDIGGGTTEVAILSMGGSAYSHSTRVGGDEMDEAIQRQLRTQIGIEVGIFEAERLKLILGSALRPTENKSLAVFGRDLSSGLPREVEVDDAFIFSALQEPVRAIQTSIYSALEQIHPELSYDIMARGVCLAGGGSLLRGLPERLERDTGIRFFRSNDPLTCVVRGVGKIIDRFNDLQDLCVA